MQKSFRRGRLLLFHTTAERIVYSVQLMVDIVTNSCYDKGRLGESRPCLDWVDAFLLRLAGRLPPALEFRRSHVMT
jgi:hypothetical protein